jgi:tetratricopeptide (TPR) repeat protein
VNDQGRQDRSANHDEEDVFLASLADRTGSKSNGSDPSGNAFPKPEGSRWTSRLAILVLTLIVFGPVVWRWWPKEVSRWYVAIATERQLDGDFSGAEEALTKAALWDEDSASILQQRGDLLIDTGRYEEALEDYVRAIQLNPDDPMARIKRSVALQHLSRHAEAIEEWLKIKTAWQDRGQEVFAMALNGLAYARALGDSDLDLALDEVNRALQFGGRHPENRAAMLDTRGYLHFLRGDYPAARQDLDRAIESMEHMLAKTSSLKGYPDPREHQQDLKQLKHHVAVMHYHRALLLESLGELELAGRDLRRVRELGYEPGHQLF